MQFPRIALSVIATIQACWMIFDGVHVLMRGKYFGPDEPGPWAEIIRFFGVDPFAMGPVFVLLGVLWLIVFVILLFAGMPQGASRLYAQMIALLTLFYLPVGTALAVVALFLLARRSNLAEG